MVKTSETETANGEPTWTEEKPKSKDRKADWVKIVLDSHPDIPPTGQPFGINGRAYILKPGVPVLVPPAIIDILEHAIVSQPEVDPISGRLGKFTDRLRFSYRVIKE